MRLFVADEARVGDGTEAVGDAAAAEDVFDFAVGVGNNADLAAVADLLEMFARAGRNDIPVRGLSDGRNQVVTQRVVVDSDLLQ